MKALARCVILVATVVAPLELRAELFNQKVSFGHYSTVWLPYYPLGEYPGLTDTDAFSDEIGVGEEMAGQTSVSINRPEGQFGTSGESSINFGTPGTEFWYGTFSADVSVSNALISHSIGTSSPVFTYSFNATEPGTLFVRLFVDGDNDLTSGSVGFYNTESQSGWTQSTYAGSNGIIPLPRTIDVEYHYSAQTPYNQDSEGRPLFSQKHTLTINLPGVGWSAGRLVGADDSVYAAFNWGHQAFPGSSPAIPEMPSALLTMIPTGLFFFARLRAKRLIAG